MENELHRIWQMVHELSEQLVLNQKLAATLQSQTKALQTEAEGIKSEFALRRVNVDISKETFESELERTNAQIIIENQALQHENRQLSMLLKEFESSLQTIMTKFRNHTLAAQQHELTLTRHYESLILARETPALGIDPSSAANNACSLQRLVANLRNLVRALSGEEPTADDPSSSSTSDFYSIIESILSLPATSDWATEREAEIARLTEENAHFRRLLSIDPETMDSVGVSVDMSRLPIESGYPARRTMFRMLRSDSMSAEQQQQQQQQQQQPWLMNSLPMQPRPAPQASYWDNGNIHGGVGGGGQQPPSPSYPAYAQNTGGAPLQRTLDMHPQRGAGPASRRPAMFGTQMNRPPMQQSRLILRGSGCGMAPPPGAGTIRLFDERSRIMDERGRSPELPGGGGVQFDASQEEAGSEGS